MTRFATVGWQLLHDFWFAYTLFIIQQIFTRSIDNTKKMVKT
jgi:hypothetical protein